MKEIIIDAKDRTLGRIATETAHNLMAKADAGYSPNIAPKLRVKVINLSEAKIFEKKIGQTTYKKYSGYPGSLKYLPVKKFWEKNPDMTFKRIVRGMLPKNRLRKGILKNLVIE